MLTPLNLTDDGTTEVLRVYEVTIERPDLTDDDGTPIVYTRVVPLRYDHDRAENRPAMSELAREEAARRAAKLERAEFGLDIEKVLLFTDPANVKLLSQKLVPARANR